MQTLRQYQRQAKADVERAWSQGHRAPLLVAPTGSGKTTVVAHLVRSFPKKRVLFLCPARELVFQGRDRLVEHGISTGIMMGRLKPEGEPMHVATIQTAARRDLGEYDLVIVDEAHRAVARQCANILNRYKGAKGLGVTATPIRMAGKRLSSVFDCLIECSTVTRLIRENYLVPYRVYAPEKPVDLSRARVDKRTKDYSTRSLTNAYNSPKIVGDVIEHYRRYGEQRPTFCYCSSIAHAQATVEALQKADIKTGLITGVTGRIEREELLGALRGRRLKILVNVGVLTEGVDAPAVSCLILLRPTLSLGLHIQILGRGARPCAGKRDCVVLDHADNHRKHGFYDEDRKWSLTGKGSQSNLAAVDHGRGKGKMKKCGNCGVQMSVNARTCPNCGEVWLPVEGEGRLVRQDRRQLEAWR